MGAHKRFILDCRRNRHRMRVVALYVSFVPKRFPVECRVQAESSENLGSIGAVFRDYPLLQPFQQSRIIQFHVQREPAAYCLIDLLYLGFQALDAMLGQGERQQVCIIEAKNIFLLHISFPCRLTKNAENHNNSRRLVYDCFFRRF